MKYLGTTLVAILLSTSFSFADGCNKHGTDTAMTCEVGQEWNAELGMCMDTNACVRLRQTIVGWAGHF